MEPIRASEINEIIRKQLESFESGVTVMEVGTVIKVGDGIAEIHGLEKVMACELLEFPHEVRGLAFAAWLLSHQEKEATFADPASQAVGSSEREAHRVPLESVDLQEGVE